MRAALSRRVCQKQSQCNIVTSTPVQTTRFEFVMVGREEKCLLEPSIVNTLKPFCLRLANSTQADLEISLVFEIPQQTLENQLTNSHCKAGTVTASISNVSIAN